MLYMLHHMIYQYSNKLVLFEFVLGVPDILLG
jgi:hypothetical protein